MMKTKIKRTLCTLKCRLHPKSVVRTTSIAALRMLHKYGGIENMQSLSEFDHPKQLRNFKILASDFGQFETIRDWECTNSDHEKIPWYTYPAYEFVNSLELAGLKVTEYGSGNSSLFFLRKGSILTSIEYSEEWYNKIKGMTKRQENFTYNFCVDQSSYSEQESIKDADLVVIDGNFRNACARFLCDQIIKNQCNPYMIIFDNSDWYTKTVNSMGKKLNWQRVDFSGFGPINNYCWITSIFFNPRRLLPGSFDIKPIAGIEGFPEDDVDFR